MPRGSKIGERRGGRQRGAPNRRTVLADRILAIASDYRTTLAVEFVAVLVKDQQLPADIRMAIARFLPAGASRAVRARGARSAADKRRMDESAGRRSASAGTAKLATLDILFNIAQDTSLAPEQRRKAASEAAQHFLPKKPGIRRWWVNAPVDNYGFAITPQIAAEYRDIKFALRRLGYSGGNGAAKARKATKMRGRLQAILHRLQCPCPSLYGRKQIKKDRERLIYFAGQREAKITLSEKQIAEEAHLRARVDSFEETPESAARQRLSALENKDGLFRNGAGRRLAFKERVDLRFLRLLYPPYYDPERSSTYNADEDLHDHPLRDGPIAADGNLYPPNSKLRPSEPKDEDFVEFVEVPAHVTYDPGYPGRWRPCEPPT